MVELEKATDEITHGSRKWDIHMMKIARLCSQMSKDPSTKVGAVVMGPDKRIVSTGYNGFPSDVPDYKEWYANRSMKHKLVIHAEMNALKQTDIPKGSSLYVYPLLPCDKCYGKIENTGITRIVTMSHNIPVYSHSIPDDYCDVCGPDKECASSRWNSSWDITEKAIKKNDHDLIYLELMDLD